MPATKATRVDESRPITLRITIVSPPAGVTWALQLGKSDLASPIRASDRAVVFETDVQLVAGSTAEPVRLRGAAVQGRPGDRFLYVNSGTYAGDRGSAWSRRAKVPLLGITGKLVDVAIKKGGVLRCQFSGTAKDGGPTCASVTLLSPGWEPG